MKNAHWIFLHVFLVGAATVAALAYQAEHRRPASAPKPTETVMMDNETILEPDGHHAITQKEWNATVDLCRQATLAIKDLENENCRLAADNQALKRQIDQMRQWSGAGATITVPSP